jgi:hypothetical protein
MAAHATGSAMRDAGPARPWKRLRWSSWLPALRELGSVYAPGHPQAFTAFYGLERDVHVIVHIAGGDEPEGIIPPLDA